MISKAFPRSCPDAPGCRTPIPRSRMDGTTRRRSRDAPPGQRWYGGSDRPRRTCRQALSPFLRPATRYRMSPAPELNTRSIQNRYASWPVVLPPRLKRLAGLRAGPASPGRRWSVGARHSRSSSQAVRRDRRPWHLGAGNDPAPLAAEPRSGDHSHRLRGRPPSELLRRCRLPATSSTSGTASCRLESVHALVEAQLATDVDTGWSSGAGAVHDRMPANNAADMRYA